MDPILRANLKTRVNSTRPIGNFNTNEFADTLKLEKAGALLRNTSQYEKWTKLCQRNDNLAVKTADIIIERHKLLEQSKSGQSVDWSLFDGLTQKLKKNTISLFKSSELSREKSGLAKTMLQTSPINTVIKEPQSDIKPEKTESLSTKAVETTINNTEEKPFSISEENFLLLNVNYKKYQLGENLTAYGDSKNLVLPLGEITRTLDFSIETDVEKGTATGWFISEGRTFDLDMTKMEAVVDGKKIPFSEKKVIVSDDDLYVDNKLLSKWFPVDFNFDFSQQAITVEPREKLPFQERLERKQGWDRLSGGRSLETRFPREKSEYKLFGPQYADLNVGSFYTHNTKTEDHDSGSTYNFHSKGDLGKMSSEIYLAGNSKEDLTDSSFSFKRVDPDANLLGRLKATKVACGDVYTTNIPIVGGNTKERGVSISNKELYKSRDYDTTSFEGSIPPDWDIELYRNDTLMSTFRVGASGKYLFDEVPIYFGGNNYKLVFYGPQGQKRVETKSIDVGNDILKKGQGEYNISMTQKGTDIYDLDELNSPDKKTTKLNASFDYGINEHISIGTGISSQETGAERHNFLNLNAKGSLKDIRLRGDYIKDTEGGDAYEAIARTQIGKVNFALKQKFYNNLLNNESSQTSLTASGIINGKSLVPDIHTSLSLQNIKTEDYYQRMIGSSIAANTKYLNLRNNLQWFDTNAPLNDSSILDGNLQISSKMKNLRLNGTLDYEVKPNTELKSVGLSAAYNITDNLSSSLFVRKNMQGNEDYDGSLKLNWNKNNGKFIISPSVAYNNDDEIKAMVNFSMSLGVDPKTKKFRASSTPMGTNGAALINVFNDKNNNSIFDQGDERIKGATVKAVQNGRHAETDKNGAALFMDLQKYRPIDILIDKNTIEDPFLEPKTEGISIIPRPGHVQEINIPVIGTGEIDGTVYKELKDGTEIPYTNTKMQLIDENGNLVQETRSEYDGFYLFMKVPHGNYTVQIDPEELEKKGLTAAPISDMNIQEEDNILNGRDFHLALLSKEKAVAEPKIASAMEKTASDKAGAIKEIEKTGDEVPVVKTEPGEVVAIAQTDKTDDKEDTYVIPPAGITVKEILKETIPVEPAFGPKVETVEPKKDVAWLAPEKKEDTTVQNEKFGLHLTSYRTSEKAIAGIDFLRNKYKDILGDADFTVKKVKVSDEKGTWFRVFAGSFNSEEKAEKLKKKVEMAMPYCKVLSLDTDANNETKKGVHLTSFRTTKKAMLSIEELKSQYPVILRDVNFSIKDVDLGKDMGKWKRVIAGNFSNEADAKLLAKRIKMSSPYSKTMRIEEKEEFGIHLASFKTCEKASKGLKILQKKFSSTLNNDDFSIRRVDLGDEKGIWYRIFSGRFKDKESAVSIKNSLSNMNQYARIVDLSNPDAQKL